MRRRIVKSPSKGGSLTRKQIREAVKVAKMRSDEYIKIGRICAMEIKINIDVDKVDNGFILFKDIYGIKLQAKEPELEMGREIYVTFPEVRARIIELLQTIAHQLRETIPEKK